MNEPIIYILLSFVAAISIAVAAIFAVSRSKKETPEKHALSLLHAKYSERSKKLSVSVKSVSVSKKKKRARIIKKTVYLSDSILDSLYNHPDSVISALAEEIVSTLSDRIRVPSWYKLRTIEKRYQSELEAIEEEIYAIDAEFFPLYNKHRDSFCKSADEAETLEKDVKLTSKKLDSLKKNPCSKQNGFFASVIAHIFFSKEKRHRVNEEINECKAELEKLVALAFEANEAARTAIDKMLTLAHERSKKIKLLEERKTVLKLKYEKEKASVTESF